MKGVFWVIKNHRVFLRACNTSCVHCFKCLLGACLCGERINLCKGKAFLNLIMLEALKEPWSHLGKYLHKPGNCDRALLVLCNTCLSYYCRAKLWDSMTWVRPFKNYWNAVSLFCLRLFVRFSDQPSLHTLTFWKARKEKIAYL